MHNKSIVWKYKTIPVSGNIVTCAGMKLPNFKGFPIYRSPVSTTEQGINEGWVWEI